MPKINIPVPDLQIDFSSALHQARDLYLQESLGKTVNKISIRKIDEELSNFVPQSSLSALAKHGLRGELVFPVPCLLEGNPFLLGYYRLLLGFSQKLFYTKESGVSCFKSMEEKGGITEKLKNGLDDLCRELIHCSIALIDGIGVDRISKELLDDLTLLTLGAQLRGGANVKKGIKSIIDVFQAITRIVKHATTDSAANRIEIRNAADRTVFIEFASDPDIVIREEMRSGIFRNIIAIEVKGGTDFSNIHNRLGEAEKSHQKAKNVGYVECWTVVNVDRVDMTLAESESPTTNRFYRLSALKLAKGQEYEDFKNRIVALTGIKSI